MKITMRWAAVAGSAMLAGALLTACDSDTTTPDAGTADSGTPRDSGTTADTGVVTNPDSGTTGFQQPANTVALNFIIDDSANKSYGANEIKWKGSWQYNETTRKITRDTSWAGDDATKYPFLYDDGAWNAGGHEPAGAVAGDNKWGITTFIDKSDMPISLEYGAASVARPTDSANSWIWRGANGMIMIPANSTEPVNAQGLTIPAWGTTDLRLTINTSTLAGGFTYTAGQPLKVKGSAWGWSEIDLTPVAGQAGVYEFILGPNVGPGTPRKNSGKLNAGDKPEFVFTINNNEYKVAGEASAFSVKAYVKAAGVMIWIEV